MQSARRLARGNALQVTVMSRKATMFKGAAFAVSAANTKGVFDILPKHIHFISIIQDGVTIQKIDGSTEHISFPTAIVKAKDDTVEIYVGMKKIN